MLYNVDFYCCNLDVGIEGSSKAKGRSLFCYFDVFFLYVFLYQMLLNAIDYNAICLWVCVEKERESERKGERKRARKGEKDVYIQNIMLTRANTHICVYVYACVCAFVYACVCCASLCSIVIWYLCRRISARNLKKCLWKHCRKWREKRRERNKETKVIDEFAISSTHLGDYGELEENVENG